MGEGHGNSSEDQRALHSARVRAEQKTNSGRQEWRALHRRSTGKHVPVQGVKEESSLCEREADQLSHGAKQWRGW